MWTTVPDKYLLLKDGPDPRKRCPVCGQSELERVQRGVIFERDSEPRPYWTLFCASCKASIGYEEI
jgi:hypothetical protein